MLIDCLVTTGFQFGANPPAGRRVVQPVYDFLLKFHIFTKYCVYVCNLRLFLRIKQIFAHKLFRNFLRIFVKTFNAMSHLGEKLKDYKNERGWTQQQMAEYLEIGYRTYQDIEKTGIIKKADVLTRVLEKTHISIDDVAKQNTQKSAYSNDDYLTRRRNFKIMDQPYLVPLVPFKAQAGYVRAYDQVDFLDTLEKYALPPGVDPRGAVWRYFEVEGDSMEPTFYSGDIVLGSMVPREDWTQLRNFYIYVIVTHDALLLKRIYMKSMDEWVLISDNEKLYDQQLIHVRDIRELWVFRRHIVNKAPVPKRFEIKV
jgi:phage repressor protein C with HTH and peptisase S24 domain